MPFKENDLNRMITLIQEIEGRKPHPHAAPTYRDTAALREIYSIVENHMAGGCCDGDTLVDGIFALRYLGDAYEAMWRIAYAMEYFKAVLKLELQLYESFGKKDSRIADDYYKAIRARNYYFPDTCCDLKEIVCKLLSEDERLKIEDEASFKTGRLKHDPIELSHAYLSVIDEVEKRMNQDKIKALHGFKQIEIFKELLSQYGVKWSSVIELNPDFRFD